MDETAICGVAINCTKVTSKVQNLARGILAIRNDCGHYDLSSTFAEKYKSMEKIAHDLGGGYEANERIREYKRSCLRFIPAKSTVEDIKNKENTTN